MRRMISACFVLTIAFAVHSQEPAQKASSTQPNAAAKNTAAERNTDDEPRKIRELVDQLASANPPPVAENTPSYELPPGFDVSKQKVVNAAEGSLRQLGVIAFPYLMERWDDKRYSTTQENALSGAVYNLSVGASCRAIVFDRLQPYGYWQETPGRRSVPRRPSYPDAFLSNRAAAEAWWKTHQGKSLHALQVEVVEWVIAEEAKEPEEFGGELATLQKVRDELKTGKPILNGNYYQRDREFRLEDPAKPGIDPFAPRFSPAPVKQK